VAEEFLLRLIAAERGEPFKDDDLPDPPPFYHDVDYVIRTWLDHKEHGSYPEAGGYNDQCEFLMQDWHTMTLYRILIENGGRKSFPLPKAAPPISRVIGE
jgi:hypothetical protein